MSKINKAKGEMFAYGGLWWETLNDNADYGALVRILNTYNASDEEFRDMTARAKAAGFNWIGIASY